MPLSHDPPEFLLHKAGQQRAGRAARGRGEKDRNRTRSHLKNGQNIYSGNNGEWTDGQRTTANAIAVAAAVLATRNCCRKSGEKDKYDQTVRRMIPRQKWNESVVRSHNTGKSALRTRGSCPLLLLHRLERSADFSAADRGRTMRRHNSICV